MIAFVTTETLEWEWERLARVVALAGHSFACASELEGTTHHAAEHDAAPAPDRFDVSSPGAGNGPRPRGATG